MVIKVLLQKMVPYIFSNLWWSLHDLITSGDETNHKDGLLNFSHLGQDLNVKCGQSNFKVCKSYFDSFKKALEVRGHVAGSHEEDKTLRASLMAQQVKNLPAMQKTWVQSLGWEDPLEKEMATHSSILAWRIPWTEEPGEHKVQSGKEPNSAERLSMQTLLKAKDYDI